MSIAKEENAVVGYKVSEGYEIGHAVAITVVGTIAVVALLYISAKIDALHPSVVVDSAGKLEAVKDHWYLARSLVLKTVGALVGGMVLGWAVLVFNHITPIDYLKVAGRHPYASAGIISAVIITMGTIWCYG